MTAILYDCRDAFARALEDLAARDPRIVALCNDSVGSSKLGGFGRLFPDRLFNVGIAEQNVVGIAAGLANAGRIPYACCASCFLTARAMEQIKADVAYSRANVKLCGMSSGLSYGALGATHHSIEDLAWMRVLGHMTVVAPADPLETEQAVREAARMDGPVFLRISRMVVPAVHAPDYVFQIGRACRLREGNDVTLIANGIMVSRALEAADALAREGIGARVLNMATIRPLDRSAILSAAAETGALVTAEEHTVYGGLGSAVAEVVVSEGRPVPVQMVGVPGVFAPTGPAEWLLDHFGLHAAGIRNAALAVLARKGCA